MPRQPCDRHKLKYLVFNRNLTGVSGWMPNSNARNVNCAADEQNCRDSARRLVRSEFLEWGPYSAGSAKSERVRNVTPALGEAT